MLPLFNLELCQRLGMIRELLHINNVNVLKSYSDLFTGLGILNTSFEYKIPVDGNILPKNIPARRLLSAVMEPVREELKCMEHNNVICPITEPTKWCSPMLVTRKKSGDIRLVVDFRELNKSVQRQTYQIPRLDDMLPLLKNFKLFSSLDSVSGYLRIPVHADSQMLLTFGTPFGRYCFQRLPFGICSAPELYQMLLSQVLSDLLGHIYYQDDILIYAENEEEHDSRLCAILDRLRSVGLKLNKSKCTICVSELEFLGHRLSANGIASSLDKVAALSTMPRPNTADSLRSFLGMTTYLGQRFVPNFSSMCQPLWSLLSQPRFKWTESATAAYGMPFQSQ